MEGLICDLQTGGDLDENNNVSKKEKNPAKLSLGNIIFDRTDQTPMYM